MSNVLLSCVIFADQAGGQQSRFSISLTFEFYIFNSFATKHTCIHSAFCCSSFVKQT